MSGDDQKGENEKRSRLGLEVVSWSLSKICLSEGERQRFASVGLVMKAKKRLMHKVYIRSARLVNMLKKNFDDF